MVCGADRLQQPVGGLGRDYWLVTHHERAMITAALVMPGHHGLHRNCYSYALWQHTQLPAYISVAYFTVRLDLVVASCLSIGKRSDG